MDNITCSEINDVRAFFRGTYANTRMLYPPELAKYVPNQGGDAPMTTVGDVISKRESQVHGPMSGGRSKPPGGSASGDTKQEDSIKLSQTDALPVLRSTYRNR